MAGICRVSLRLRVHTTGRRSVATSSTRRLSSLPRQTHPPTGIMLVPDFSTHGPLSYNSPLDSGSSSCHSVQRRRGLFSSTTILDRSSLDVHLENPSQTPGRRPRGWSSHLISIGAILGLVPLVPLFSSFGNFFSDWPEELRNDLQSAVCAKDAKDYALSEAHLLRAYLRARSMSLDKLGPEPYLKLSAIAIALGEVLELQNEHKHAFRTYRDIFGLLSTVEQQLMNSKSRLWDAMGPLLVNLDEQVKSEAIASSSSSDKAVTEDIQELSFRERLRLISLALRLNELAETVKPTGFKKDVFFKSVKGSCLLSSAEEIVPKKLNFASMQEAPVFFLPSWARYPNPLVPLKAYVNTLYEQGDFKSALILNLLINQYLRFRISRASTPTCEFCEFAEILNRSAAFAIKLNSQTNLDVAERFLSDAKKAATTFIEARRPDLDLSRCEQILPVILVNLRTVKEMREKLEDAKSNFSDALSSAKAPRQHECAEKTQEELTRVTQLKTEEKSKKGEHDAAAKEGT